MKPKDRWKKNMRMCVGRLHYFDALTWHEHCMFFVCRTCDDMFEKIGRR